MINGLHTLNVLTEVAEERHAQDETWGLQDFPFHHGVDGGGHVLVGQPYETWMESLKEACDRRRDLAKAGGPDRRSGLLVLLEEVAEAAAERNPTRIRAELVQVAAVAVKLIEALDRAEAKAHGPGCERGMWHGGQCGPSAVLREARMSVPPVPATFSRITKETVEHTIRELMGPDATLALRLEPIPFLKEQDPEAVAAVAEYFGPGMVTEQGADTVTFTGAEHPYGGAGRLHGICRCGEGRDAPIHRVEGS